MRAWLLVSLLLLPSAARAADENCMTRILADVPAEEAPEQMKSKSNKFYGPVTLIKVDKKSGKMLFCAGPATYCYNSNAFQFISPCRIKRDETMNNAEYFTFFTR